jgi:hypothetical protein
MGRDGRRRVFDGLDGLVAQHVRLQRLSGPIRTPHA